MGITVNIQPHQSKALKEICSIETNSLKAVVALLNTIDGPFLRPVELNKALCNNLDLDTAKIVTRQIISLMALRRERHFSSEEVVSSLGNAIHNLADWSDDEKDRWDRTAPLLIDILSLNAICAIAKSMDLAYDYTNLLEKARILTDIRPVFDDEGSVIVGGIVTQTLRVHFYDHEAENSQSLSISMDEDDIHLLKEACEKALNKSSNAKQFLKESCHLNAFIVGEENADAE